MSHRVVRQRRAAHSHEAIAGSRSKTRALYRKRNVLTAQDFRHLVQCYDMDFVLQNFHNVGKASPMVPLSCGEGQQEESFVSMTSTATQQALLEDHVMRALYKRLPESWIVPHALLSKERVVPAPRLCDGGGSGNEPPCSPHQTHDNTKSRLLVTSENSVVPKPVIYWDQLWGWRSEKETGSVQTIPDLLSVITRTREAVGMDCANALPFVELSPPKLAPNKSGGQGGGGGGGGGGGAEDGDGDDEGKETTQWQERSLAVLRSLVSIEPELRDLNAMVGMKTLKSAVVQQIMYFIQGLHDTKELKHLVITGPPGTGKTEVAKLLGRIYARLGVFSSASHLSSSSVQDKVYFKKATRADLIAAYVGQTALKTQAVMEECCTGKVAMASTSSSSSHPSSRSTTLNLSSSSSSEPGSMVGSNGRLLPSSLVSHHGESFRVSGGILFIDEAYALGSKDDFSKEFADTLCEGMTDRSDRLMVILAGYAKDLEDRFFSLNPGLSSRFVWRFDIPAYSGAELCQIFEQKLAQSSFSWSEPATSGGGGGGGGGSGSSPEHVCWFEKHVRDFPHAGRDMEILFMKTKIAKSRHSFLAPLHPPYHPRKLTIQDLDHGFALFREHKESQITRRETESSKSLLYSMYS